MDYIIQQYSLLDNCIKACRCTKMVMVIEEKRFLLKNGVNSEHIIEVALDSVEDEELRDPKKCYQYIKTVMKDDQLK
ncbi:MAG: hypothetical protein K2N15_10865 [Lachnospiraceae bacterium]|nr:hypothetical protein [Lachnospiraceae bacterium]